VKSKLKPGVSMDVKLRRGEGKVMLLNRVTNMQGREQSWDARVLTGQFACDVGRDELRKPGHIICFCLGDLL